jgi:hypothetical protein
MTNPGYPRNTEDAPSFSSDDVITGAAQGWVNDIIAKRFSENDRPEGRP